MDYHQHWKANKRSRLIQALTRDPETRTFFEQKATYLQSGWVIDEKLVVSGEVPNTAWKKRFNIHRAITSMVPSECQSGLAHWTYCDLLQYLQNLSKRGLVGFAAKYGIKLNEKLNNMDCVKAILRTHPSSKEDHEYFKNFPLNDGVSGGVLCLLCTHGFIYYSKIIIGGEGCSDVADAVRLFQPKIVVYDYAAGLVAYMRNADPNFFHQSNGLPGGDDEEFIESIKAQALNCGDKQKVYPLLCEWQTILRKQGSFAVIDGFHIQNATKDVDRFGRSLRGIHNIEFKPNSAIQEQIWSQLGKHLKSLTQMSYANFISQWNYIALEHNRNLQCKQDEHRLRQTVNLKSPNKRTIAMMKVSCNAVPKK
jgi:hypothetical protein